MARAIEPEILPACERHGLGTLTYSPLASGVLAGRYARGAAPEPGSRLDRMRSSSLAMARKWAEGMLNERTLDIAGEAGAVAAELGTTSAAVALAWVRSRPGFGRDRRGPVVAGPRRWPFAAI